MGRKDYEEMLLSIVRFDEVDVITFSSNNNNDNIGDWNDGWNGNDDDWLKDIIGNI